MDLIEQQQNEIFALRERIRQLESLLLDAGYTVPIEYRLTETQEKIFLFLLCGKVRIKEQIWNMLYSINSDDAPSETIIDVFVCKLRKKLDTFGIKIRTVWGRGYQLDVSTLPENRNG